ncbi:hypothetical protein LCI18_006866 [Fusarium solani-melongenae]|uniref:Uncharacterized protein n=1 Tax=Fusarium solani subsp. cucurbitae TaxID=2747967 RepID=A0ACD3Z511_FUSSC|nr:hypothetical protein LCI18_006866 [Fusarium solani-melongenae]
MEWKLSDLPEGTKIAALRKCREHPASFGILSSLANPGDSSEDLKRFANHQSLVSEGGSLTKRYDCTNGGHGRGADYDYGCNGGWCWRNCDVNVGWPGGLAGQPKPWCWLAYDGGKGGWTPCGRWQDCEWSYNNKDAKCGKGNCKACGCGC